MDFSEELISWYKLNQRELPWRKTTNPYYIWISEIILQQTRVKQGLSYYNKFISQFPTIHHLANAKEDTIMKLWQGLGYYNRARNMHTTAKYISSKLKGEFPNSYKELIQLKGIGEYTAAAISSFCYKESQAVVDGNVYRLLSRYFGIHTPIDSTLGKKKFKSLACELLNKQEPGIHNQAIMEFGALQCKPYPNCCSCPLNISCIALNKNKIKTLPVKSKKIKQTIRYFNYMVITDRVNIYIEQRMKKDIWKKLYQFPNTETQNESVHLPEYGHKINLNKLIITNSTQVKHVLSHQIIYIKFWLLISSIQLPEIMSYELIPLSKLESYPVPKVVENYMLDYPELFKTKSYL